MTKKKIVLGYGHFSAIHPGHIRYLKEAKELGDTLIVAIKPDSQENSYPFTAKERAATVANIDCVDQVFIIDSQGIKGAIAAVMPDTILLGKELQGSSLVTHELDEYIKSGGDVCYHAEPSELFSIEFLTNRSEEIECKRVALFKQICQRYQITCESLKQTLEGIKSSKILVIGESILDEYVACQALGMSAEAPVIVVKETAKKQYAGGAAVVTLQSKVLGASPIFLSVIGDDDHGREIQEIMMSNNISARFIVDSSRPTIYKKRYLVGSQKVFRVSRLSTENISENIENQIIDEIEKVSSQITGIIVSDFAYGLITERILAKLKQVSQNKKIMICGDSQSSSQTGDINKFTEFTLLCPNEKEARMALKDTQNSIEVISQNLIANTCPENLIMKLGSEGFITYYIDENNKRRKEAFPALSTKPVDVAGAGDALLSVLSSGIAIGENIINLSLLACIVTKLCVETVGNQPVPLSMIKKEIDLLF